MKFENISFLNSNVGEQFVNKGIDDFVTEIDIWVYLNQNKKEVTDIINRVLVTRNTKLLYFYIFSVRYTLYLIDLINFTEWEEILSN